MALIALIQRANLRSRGAQIALVLLGVFGASLFYGDGMITPAISVLSRGRRPRGGRRRASRRLVVPITLVVLDGPVLRPALRHRRGRPVLRADHGRLVRRARAQRPVRALEHPEIFGALSPHHGAEFLFNHGHEAFVALGGVVLAVTGAEALYADMGHFGARAIRKAWFAPRLPRADPQLPRPGRADPVRPERLVEPVLPALPGLGADPDGDPLDGRGDHRLPGRDLRRLQRHPPGDPARLPAAPGDPPHLQGGGRPGLRPGRQLDHLRRGRRARRRLRLLREARVAPTGSRSPARWRSTRCCSSSSCARCGASRCGS